MFLPASDPVTGSMLGYATHPRIMKTRIERSICRAQLKSEKLIEYFTFNCYFLCVQNLVGQELDACRKEYLHTFKKW